MTIKEFAALCQCTTQTLRYYDRIELLKPMRVDSWTGYRHYEAEQALDFIKIKNLQAADFSIGEIKELLGQSDGQIFQAFEQKIQQQEQKLRRIREIQQSYLRENDSMKKVIQSISDFITGQLNDHEMLREFGMTPEDSPRVAEIVRHYLEMQILAKLPGEQQLTLTVDKEVIHDPDQIAQRLASLDLHDPPATVLLGDDTAAQEPDFSPDQYESLWEAHDWIHAREFLDALPPLEQGQEYCFFFRLNRQQYPPNVSFAMYMMGAVLLRKEVKDVTMNCTVEHSDDGYNHFALLQKKSN